MVNNTSYTATIGAATSAGGTTPSGGLTLAIPANSSCLVRCDGTNIRDQLNRVVGDLTVGGTFTTAGNVVADGNLTLLNSAFLGTALAATISVATPSIVTVAATPALGAAIVFSVTGGTLPTGITAGTTYFVSPINSTTFNFSTSSTLSPLVAVSGAGSGTFTVSTVSLTNTPPLASNSTQIATTAFAKAAAAQAAGTALQDPGTNGMLARTASTVTAARTITGSSTITVTNGDGVAGNPTISIPAGGITSTQLAAGAVTASSISSSTIDAIKLTGGQSGSAPAYALRAWCQYTAVGGTTVPTATGNIASITYNGAGNYSVAFTTPMQDAAYSAVGSTYYGAALGVYSLVFTTYNFSTTGFQVLTYINGQNVYQMTNATPMSIMVVR
jgi:hypothetical protein